MPIGRKTAVRTSVMPMTATGYFRHRLTGRFKRRKPFCCHQTLDILHHDDGVINNDADCETMPNIDSALIE